MGNWGKGDGLEVGIKGWNGNEDKGIGRKRRYREGWKAETGERMGE